MLPDQQVLRLCFMSDCRLDAGGTSTAALWNINGKAQLEKKAALPAGTGIPRSVLWHGQRPTEAITIEDGRWRLWNIDSTANVRQLTWTVCVPSFGMPMPDVFCLELPVRLFRPVK